MKRGKVCAWCGSRKVRKIRKWYDRNSVYSCKGCKRDFVMNHMFIKKIVFCEGTPKRLRRHLFRSFKPDEEIPWWMIEDAELANHRYENKEVKI